MPLSCAGRIRGPSLHWKGLLFIARASRIRPRARPRRHRKLFKLLLQPAQCRSRKQESSGPRKPRGRTGSYEEGRKRKSAGTHMSARTNTCTQAHTKIAQERTHAHIYIRTRTRGPIRAGSRRRPCALETRRKYLLIHVHFAHTVMRVCACTRTRTHIHSSAGTHA